MRLCSRQLQRERGLSDQQMNAIRRIFAKSGYIGQGNPAVTQHPVTPEQCQAKLDAAGVRYENPRFEKICEAKYMAPLIRSGQRSSPKMPRPASTSSSFPTSLRLSRGLGESPRGRGDLLGGGRAALRRPRMGGRVRREPSSLRITASIWQGDCRLKTRFTACASRTTRLTAPTKRWSYGPDVSERHLRHVEARRPPAAMAAAGRDAVQTLFRPGTFPACHSPLEVYDLNGNAAEHMNLPLNESQMSSRGSKELGYTEMKGSWFIFDTYRAHEDWCRWRAPFWHGTRVMDEHSHANYHLGFRCCKSLN